jgi:hypothetical protein
LTASWPVIAVDDEEDLGRVDGLLDIRHLLHHPLVDVHSAGGVDDEDVAAVRRASATASRRRGRRPEPASPVLLDRKDRDVDRGGELLQLVDGGRTVHVGGGHHRRATLST